jgi:sigma-54 interacting transcriptional regulator
MGLQERLLACDGTLDSFLAAVLPGTSAGIARLRRTVRELCCNPLAHGVLILGPAGSGKSTLARAIALARFVAMTDADRARGFARSIRLDGPGRLSEVDLPWYCELAVTGLVHSVAAAQIQGYARSVSGGEARSQRGVFERAAMGGNVPREDVHPGVGLTRGVVFLDEIADLDQTLQPLLLGAVAGAPIYRVGEEGYGDGFRFRGLTIAATWRSVDAASGFRQDLLQRLSDYVLEVPSLAERADEMPEIVDAIVDEIRSRFVHELDDLLKLPGVDKTRLEPERDRVKSYVLAHDDRDALIAEDWHARGELRGLSQTVRRVVASGTSIRDALAAMPAGTSIAREREIGALLLGAVRDRPTAPDDGLSLKDILNDVESGGRRQLKERLQGDGNLIRGLAEQLGIPEARLRRQVSELGR